MKTYTCTACKGPADFASYGSRGYAGAGCLRCVKTGTLKFHTNLPQAVHDAVEVASTTVPKPDLEPEQSWWSLPNSLRMLTNRERGENGPFWTWKAILGASMLLGCMVSSITFMVFDLFFVTSPFRSAFGASAIVLGIPGAWLFGRALRRAG